MPLRAGSIKKTIQIVRQENLNFHDLLLFATKDFVDFGDVGVRVFLEQILGLVSHVFGEMLYQAEVRSKKQFRLSARKI